MFDFNQLVLIHVLYEIYDMYTRTFYSEDYDGIKSRNINYENYLKEIVNVQEQHDLDDEDFKRYNQTAIHLWHELNTI